jgi:hypothetical protein
MMVSDADMIVCARLTRTALGLAEPRLTGPARDQAVVQLASTAPGRTDLLARCAGLAVGLHEGDPDEDRYLRAAQLCIDAGADTALINGWIAEGRRTRSAARP